MILASLLGVVLPLVHLARFAASPEPSAVQDEKIVVPSEEKPAAAERTVERPLAVPPPNPLATKPTTQPARSVMFDCGAARKITFVCDASGSMLNKFSTFRRELANTIMELQATQSFNVVFFQEQKFTAFDNNGLVMATPENKLRATNFLEDKITPRGETSPNLALYFALLQHPDLVYVLTDGDWPDNDAVLESIRQVNRNHKIRINTVAFVSDADTDTQFIKLALRESR